MKARIQSTTKRSKSVLIKGVKFRPAEILWEDAFGISCKSLPDFEKMMVGEEFIGSKITAVGLVAKIGKYLLVITKKNEEADEYDYTVIPLSAKTKVTYH